MQAAPKPLSIFTTERPGEQQASRLLRAVFPPSQTPYPTDVGTPMIHVLQSVPPVCWVVLALVCAVGLGVSLVLGIPPLLEGLGG